MAEKKMVPELRFRGHTNAWEQRKVGDLGNIITGSTPPTNDQTNYGGEYLFVSPADIHDARYVENTITTLSKKGFRMSRILKEGSVLFVSIGSTIGKVAQTKRLSTTNQQINAIEVNDVLDKDFIFSLMENKAKIIKGLAATQAVPIVNKTSFSDVDIYIPEDSKEQSQIGVFFKNIDNLITLHQHKYDKTQNVKKAMLEKMFPKNDEDKPEIRFEGFTDDWEQRKLLDSVDKVIDFRGRTPKKMGLDWSDTGYLALSALNVKNGFIDPSVDAHYGDRVLYDTWMLGNELHKGQVLFTTEAPMGNVAQVPDDAGYILSQRTIAFEIKPKLIVENFLTTVLGSPKSFKDLTALCSGGTAKGVSQKSLSEFYISVPKNLNEQEKIAGLFKHLGNLITLHQHELEKLKNIKKAMLKKMFP